MSVYLNASCDVRSVRELCTISRALGCNAPFLDHLASSSELNNTERDAIIRHATMLLQAHHASDANQPCPLALIVKLGVLGTMVALPAVNGAQEARFVFQPAIKTERLVNTSGNGSRTRGISFDLDVTLLRWRTSQVLVIP